VKVLGGENFGDWYGRVVANLGDINNDGYEELAVSATAYDTIAGKVYIYLGNGSFDFSSPITLSGKYTIQGFGLDISGAGRLNKDGYDDFLITQLSGAFQDTGRVLVYYGGSTIDTIPTDTFFMVFSQFGIGLGSGDLNKDGFRDIAIRASGRVWVYLQDSTLVDTTSFFVTDSSSGFGGAGILIGDVTGDGYEDLLVSSSSAGKNSTYLYFGRDSLIATPDIIFPRFGGIAMGDVNGDNTEDLGITTNDVVRAFYFGGSSLDTTPDVRIGSSIIGYLDSNQFGDIVAAGSLFGAAGVADVYLGGNPPDTLKDWSVNEPCASFSTKTVLDFNGDGLDEVVLGSFCYNCCSGDYQGRVHIYSPDTTTDVESEGEQPLPKMFELHQNHPNPFNASTIISYSLRKSGPVKLSIYNIRGEMVRQLVDLTQIPGPHRVTWDGKNEKGKEVASGLYFARLLAGAHSQTIKLTLLR